MDSMVLTALLEAVSVLAGVLIAFSIDAAWDNRRDRGREKGYLSALAAEIETNRERFCGYLDQLQSQLHTGDRALREIVFAQGTVDPGAVRGWLQSTGALYLELPEQAALSDILSSGGVAFIEDPGVRLGTHAYVMSGPGASVPVTEEGGSSMPVWAGVGIPGHMESAEQIPDPEAARRVRLPDEFLYVLNAELGPGSTLMITDAPILESTTGVELAVLSSSPHDAAEGPSAN